MKSDKKIHLIYFADRKYFNYFLFSIRSLLKLKFPDFGNIYLYVNENKLLSEEQLDILKKELPFVIVRKTKKMDGWGINSVKAIISTFNEVAKEVDEDDYICKIDSDTYLLDKKIFSKVVKSDDVLIGYEDHILGAYTFTQGGCYFIKASFVPNLNNHNDNLDMIVMKKLNNGLFENHYKTLKNVPEDPMIHNIVREQTDDIKYLDFMVSAWENPFQKKIDILHFSSKHNKEILDKVIFKPRFYVLFRVYLNYIFHKYKNKIRYVYIPNIKRPKRLLKYIESKRGSKNIIHLTLVYLKDVIWSITSFNIFEYIKGKRVSKENTNVTRVYLKDSILSLKYFGEAHLYALLYRVAKKTKYLDKLAPNGNYIVFFYDGQDLKIEEMIQFESRGDSVRVFLEKLILKDKEYFTNKRGIITFADGPYNNVVYRLFDVALSTTLKVNKKNIAKPFPCFAFESWPEIGIEDSQKIINDFIQKNDINYENERIFWIGTAQHHSRVILNNIAQEHPHIFDVTLMGWHRKDDGKLKPEVRYVSIPDHVKYKYLIDCPGQSGNYSARLKWLLATGRPVFIVERDIIEWWHRDLIPFVHYVPVKKDLSDLVEKYEYMESNPDLYEKISSNAKEFARTYFNVSALLNSTLKNLE